MDHGGGYGIPPGSPFDKIDETWLYDLDIALLHVRERGEFEMAAVSGYE